MPANESQLKSKFFVLLYCTLQQIMYHEVILITQRNN